jgi:hypothetical protein
MTALRISSEVISALETVAQSGIAAPGAAALLDVGTSEFVEFIEAELLNGLLPNGGSTFRVFEGAYGAGKTHLLQLLANAAAQQGMITVHADLAQGQSLETPQHLVSFLLQNMQWTGASGTHRSLPRILQAMSREGVVTCAGFQVATFAHSGFAAAMRMTVVGEVNRSSQLDLISRYLCGERVPAREVKQAAISGLKRPLSNRNAEQVLRTALTGLHSLGCPGVVLLFDESERTLQVRGATASNRVRGAANLMRRLIDAFAVGDVRGTLAVFAVLPGFTNDCGRAYPALGQRLSGRRPSNEKIAWRWPVLQLDEIGSYGDPDEFVVAAAQKLTSIPGIVNGNRGVLEQTLIEHGRAVVKVNAGSGYRRQVMKDFASQILASLPSGGSHVG